MTPTFALVVVSYAGLTLAPAARAQDTVRIAELQESAIRSDPRAGEFDLLRSASGLRMAVIGAERLPQIDINGWASHQSDLTQPSVLNPSAGFPTLPLDRWETTLDVEQLLYDGGEISRRKRLERARHAEAASEVSVALYGLRSDVNSAFFSAFLLQQRSAEYDALITDLETRLAAVRARVEAGTALGREAAEVEAELVRAMVQRNEAQASRRASLAILADLVSRPLDSTAVLVLPAEEPEKTHPLTPASITALRQRPEFDRYRETRLRLGREAELARVENAPRISAFGQGGVGLPGLDQFRTTSDAFWRAGVKVAWRPWTWKSAGRTADALQHEQQALDTEERAFARSLGRAVLTNLEDIQRLTASLAEDERVVQLRAEVEQQARAQHDEGTITTADYVETRTDVLDARLTLQRHRVELAQARAAYLTTLGLAPR